MIFVHFQGKQFNIKVIQAYASTTNAKDNEVEWFYEGLQDFLELTPKKDVLFITGDWNAKIGNQDLCGPGIKPTSTQILYGLRHQGRLLNV